MSGPSERSAKTVLLVDDCADTREMYAEFLGESFAVTEAASGAEALSRAREHTPDVVVLDFSLPDMNGEEVIRHLRQGSGTAIPVIVVSGYDRPATPHAPWDAYLVKPCQPDQLRACLDEVMSRPR